MPRILDATFLYPTGGAEAIDVALKILGGEQVPKKIVLDSRVFTTENVAQGGEELKMSKARDAVDQPADEAAEPEGAESDAVESPDSAP